MKNFLLLFAGFLVIVVLFADGGLNVSPNISPSPSFSFSPSVNYSPDRSTVTTNIGTNIEHQSVFIGGGQQEGGGVTTVNPQQGTCTPLIGETVVNVDTMGACIVVNANGERFFMNALGQRFPLQEFGILSRSEPQPTHNQTQAAAQPQNQPATTLQPAGQLTVEQLQVAYLRNGGRLPLTWSWFGEDRKRRFLTDRPETWR